MGKRARTRAQTGGGSKPARAGAKAAPGAKRTVAASAPRAKRSVAPPAPRAKLDPVRRVLTAYVGAALVLAVLTLVGILVLGGTLGPYITLGVVILAAGLVHRAATGRLAGTTLRDEDRVMQTMAGGMLVLCVVLAAAGAVVATLA